MVCEHLSEVEQALLDLGTAVTFRGQAWSKNCREWVYFDVFLDLPRVRKHHLLPSAVKDHEHRGTHDGQECGLVCSLCHDALMGHAEGKSGASVFPPEGYAPPNPSFKRTPDGAA